MIIENVPLHEIAKWPRNPKDHDIGAITQSFERFGFISPLIVDEGTHRLVAGHGRLDALLQRHSRGEAPPRHVDMRSDGEWLVPVVRGITFPNESEAMAYLVADNQMTMLGGWNDQDLAEMLTKLPSLEGVGFDADDLDDLMKRLGGGVVEGTEPTTGSSIRQVTCPECGNVFILGEQ